jgi:hypothetical protein
LSPIRRYAAAGSDHHLAAAEGKRQGDLCQDPACCMIYVSPAGNVGKDDRKPKSLTATLLP